MAATAAAAVTGTTATTATAAATVADTATELAAGLKGAYAVGGQLARAGATILPLII